MFSIKIDSFSYKNLSLLLGKKHPLAWHKSPDLLFKFFNLRRSIFLLINIFLLFSWWWYWGCCNCSIKWTNPTNNECNFFGWWFFDFFNDEFICWRTLPSSLFILFFFFWIFHLFLNFSVHFNLLKAIWMNINDALLIWHSNLFCICKEPLLFLLIKNYFKFFLTYIAICLNLFKLRNA